MNWERKSTNILAFLILSFLLLILRLDTVPQIFKYPFFNLIDPDSYYHLRRIQFTINNFPDLLIFDPFLSFPYGEFVPWPPLFDFISAFIGKIFSENLLPFLGIFYFYLAFLIIFFATRRKPVVCITTCFLFAYAGILRVYTSAGRLDHHSFEMLIVTALSVIFLMYYKNSKIFYLLLFILTIILSFLTWPGAIIYSAPLILFALYQNIFGKPSPHINKGLFIAYHVTAIFLAIYLKVTNTIENYPYSFKFLSGFHRDFCFVVSIIFFTFHLSTIISKRYEKKIYNILLWIINPLILTLLFKNFFLEILSGLNFIGKSEYILKTAEEASPLFFSNIYSIKDEFKRNLFLFTPLILIFPYVIWKYYQRYKRDYLFFYTLFFFLLTLFQLRFGFFFMLGYSVILGVVLEKSIKKLSPLFVITLFLILSILTFFSSYKDSYKRFTNDEIIETLIFLRDKTPYNDDFIKGNLKYGILASWELGHHIVQISNRPAIANPFIGVAPNNGYKDFIDVLFAKDEKNVVDTLEKRKGRFLILENLESSIITDWDNVKWGNNPYIINNTLTPKVLELYSYNLFYFNGLTKEGKSINEKIRLIFKSNKGNVKLYENVRGCKIILKNKSGYILKGKITDDKNSFFYINTGWNEGNNQIFILPYSNEKRYSFYASEIYIEKEGLKKPLFITEDMVLNGNEIIL
ncbi:MAG: hypothetical protein N2202_07890 [Proteobacteria bacterium]|nr:hypothetical protein [Pseudomonadota bacterium]